jgi:hypothetical protein
MMLPMEPKEPLGMEQAMDSVIKELKKKKRCPKRKSKLKDREIYEVTSSVMDEKGRNN